MECPRDKCREITFILRSMNLDCTIKCADGKTPLELAVEHDNQEFIESYNRFNDEDELMDADSEIRKEVQALRDVLAEKYAFRTSCTLYVKPFRTNFPMPAWVFAKDVKYGSIPLDCTIHEAQLKPLVETAHQKIKKTSEAIKALNFVIDEADTHVLRRKKLVNIQDPDFDPSETFVTRTHITDTRVYRKKK